MSKATTLSSPFYDIKPSAPSHPDVRMMSVDILPASMPLDASIHFSNALGPYLGELVRQYQTEGASNGGAYADAIRDATIAENGKLRGEWQGLLWDGVRNFAGTNYIKHQTVARPPISGISAGLNDKKRFLLLGSGMVAQPAVDYLLNKLGGKLVIGWFHLFWRLGTRTDLSVAGQRATMRTS